MKWPRFLRAICDAACGFDPADPPVVRAHDRAYRRFLAEKHGADFAEINLEYQLRTALVRLQRLASEAALADPDLPVIAIRTATDEVCRTLSEEKAKILRETVAQLTFRDLFTPEAHAAVTEIIMEEALAVRAMPTPDQIGALRLR